MKQAIFTVAACAALAVPGLACGGESDENTSPSAASETPARTSTGADTPARRGATVKLTDTEYGRILANGRGRALYLFTRERGSASRCYGDCAKEWPPFLTRARPSAGKGARGRLLGTTRRRDGTRQVTYRGHPLYFYVGDRKAGQVLCQNVFEFGGTWLVVSASGRAIR